MYEELLPTFQETTTVINTVASNSLSSLGLQWLGFNAKLCSQIIQDANGNKKCETLESILLLTSMLENALANIYYTETKGKQAPHLLKDLINTQEIRKIIGPELVICNMN